MGVCGRGGLSAAEKAKRAPDQPISAQDGACLADVRVQATLRVHQQHPVSWSDAVA